MIYRVREPLLAVLQFQPPEGHGFITISPGSMITVRIEVQESGFVDVLYNGEIVSAFMRDIEARAEVVEAAGSG